MRVAEGSRSPLPCPGDDVGARNKLRQWLNLSHDLDTTPAVKGITAAWQPYAGLARFRLLLRVGGKGRPGPRVDRVAEPRPA